MASRKDTDRDALVGTSQTAKTTHSCSQWVVHFIHCTPKSVVSFPCSKDRGIKQVPHTCTHNIYVLNLRLGCAESSWPQRLEHIVIGGSLYSIYNVINNVHTCTVTCQLVPIHNCMVFSSMEMQSTRLPMCWPSLPTQWRSEWPQWLTDSDLSCTWSSPSL